VVVSNAGFAYERPALRVALETAAALIALLAAYLAFGRFRRSADVPDLALALALALLAVSNLAFGALPTALEWATAPATWASVAGHLLGAVVLAAAAFAPDRVVSRPERAASWLFGAAAAVLAVMSVTLAASSSYLPAGVEQEPSVDRSAANLTGHPIVVAAHVLGMVAFAAAALGFLRRGERMNDSFLRWVAVAALLAAFARLHYVLYPSLYSGWLYSGDVYRLLFYVVLMAAGVREIAGYWRGLARSAVLEERRRVARDLHDGVAQELAFIVRRSRRLKGANGDAAVITSAAERALDDSRRAIAALTRPADEPLDVALAEVAENVTARTGTEVVLALAPNVEVQPNVREALIRIATEALRNAARHAQAQRVRLELAGGRRVRLSVVDDGCGFDPESVRPSRHGGFGLTSMRERAAGIGADLSISSRPGQGTQVEVTLP
jgi:signal transduction histidine kinase